MWFSHLTYIYFRASPEMVVRITDTFDNNFEIENGFTKYLKESCRKCSEWHFSIKYFPNFAFVCKILKLLDFFWTLWASMG